VTRKAKKEKTDVKGVHHRKMRLKGGLWDGVIVRQYADRINGRWFFADKIELKPAHVYEFEQPPVAKKPGSMRFVR
jgi:hypothetical protein